MAAWQLINFFKKSYFLLCSNLAPADSTSACVLSCWYFFIGPRGLFERKNDRLTMAGRSSKYNLNDVLQLLDSENLVYIGLVESENSDCEDGEVGSYLPEVQLDVEEPYHSVEGTLGVDSDPGHSKSTSKAAIVLVDSVNLWLYRLRLVSMLVKTFETSAKL